MRVYTRFIRPRWGARAFWLSPKKSIVSSVAKSFSQQVRRLEMLEFVFPFFFGATLGKSNSEKTNHLQMFGRETTAENA